MVIGENQTGKSFSCEKRPEEFVLFSLEKKQSLKGNMIYLC